MATQQTAAPLAEHHQIHGLQPVLPVADVAAACGWFCRVLGFAIDFSLGDPPQRARVKLGDSSWGDLVDIHLQRQDTPAAPCGQTRLHLGQTRLHWGHDVDSLHVHAVREGARVLQAPADTPWGLRECTLEGPSGHRLVLAAEVQDAQYTHATPQPVSPCYQRLRGKEQALLALVRRSVPLLQRLGLASDRAPLVMQAADGTLVQAFEWRSAQAIADAPQHPEVLALWADSSAACEHVPLAQLREAHALFAGFTPLDR